MALGSPAIRRQTETSEPLAPAEVADTAICLEPPRPFPGLPKTQHAVQDGKVSRWECCGNGRQLCIQNKVL